MLQIAVTQQYQHKAHSYWYYCIFPPVWVPDFSCMLYFNWETNLLTSPGNDRASNSASRWSMYLLLIYRFHGYILLLMWPHFRNDCAMSFVSHWDETQTTGAHLLHSKDRIFVTPVIETVLLCSPKHRACLHPWKHLAGVPGEHEGL